MFQRSKQRWSRPPVPRWKLKKKARAYPHPGWFFAKSAEALENRRDMFFGCAKEFARI
jgi:hypothetical protein